MVGNKHKNGIICTFPNCNKTMRTQKFKMHFTRAHLKEGEIYSIDHRRQFEVAREENARSTMKSELVNSGATVPETEMIMTEGGSAQVNNMISVAAAHKEMTQARRVLSQPINFSSQPKTPSISATGIKSGASDMNATPKFVQLTTTAPTFARVSLPSEHTSCCKRPLAAIEGSFEDATEPTSVFLMQFITLMDQRFQELVGKMGEMIDVQKNLIDTLQASGRSPSSSLSQAFKVASKKRKKDTSSRECSSSEYGNEANGEDPGFVL